MCQNVFKEYVICFLGFFLIHTYEWTRYERHIAHTFTLFHSIYPHLYVDVVVRFDIEVEGGDFVLLFSLHKKLACLFTRQIQWRYHGTRWRPRGRVNTHCYIDSQKNRANF